MATITVIASMLLPGLVQTPPTETEREGEAEIVVRAPISEAERQKELREFTRSIVREPRRGQPVAKFFYPVCPKVSGIAPADARAIEDRIRSNAQSFGLGDNPDAKCTPTIRVAFMAPIAGSPETWLSDQAASLAHLSIYQRREVLSETGPVRAWNKVKVRDFWGQPLGLIGGDSWGVISQIEPQSSADPITRTEITGAAILIERSAAHGLTLAQLADYVTMRSLVETSQPDTGSNHPASTILSVFQDNNAPGELTSFDRALINGLYNASRNSSARRVIKNVAENAVKMERSE